jgi:hypothetical protein
MRRQLAKVETGTRKKLMEGRLAKALKELAAAEARDAKAAADRVLKQYADELQRLEHRHAIEAEGLVSSVIDSVTGSSQGAEVEKL